MKKSIRTWAIENERDFGELVDEKAVVEHELKIKDQRIASWEKHHSTHTSRP
jgi:hypothetical protein